MPTGAIPFGHSEAHDSTDEKQAVLKLGGDSGTIILYRSRNDKEFSYYLHSFDASDLDEGPLERYSKAVFTWKDALQLLDGYPWVQLYPIKVHDEFKEMVWIEIKNRLKVFDCDQDRLIFNWKRCCGIDK